MPAYHLSISNPNNNNNSRFVFLYFYPIFFCCHICAMQQQNTLKLIYVHLVWLYDCIWIIFIRLGYVVFHSLSAIFRFIRLFLFRSSFAALTLHTFIYSAACTCIMHTKCFCMKPEPSTEIIGAPDLYIETGSTINLTCVIENSPEPPAYIFWNHNNAVSIFTILFKYNGLSLSASWSSSSDASATHISLNNIFHSFRTD